LPIQNPSRRKGYSPEEIQAVQLFFDGLSAWFSPLPDQQVKELFDKAKRILSYVYPIAMSWEPKVFAVF
jgi:hypothetical protein